MSKKSLGAKTYLYPLTTIIVGANVKNKACLNLAFALSKSFLFK